LNVITFAVYTDGHAEQRKQGGRNAKVAPGINPNAPIKIMMNIAKPKEEEPQAVPVAVLAPVQTPVPRSQIKQMGSSASQPSATPTLYVPPPHAQSQHSTPSSYVPLKPSVHPTKEFDKVWMLFFIVHPHDAQRLTIKPLID
jgi:hypothetical protein